MQDNFAIHFELQKTPYIQLWRQYYSLYLVITASQPYGFGYNHRNITAGLLVVAGTVIDQFLGFYHTTISAVTATWSQSGFGDDTVGRELRGHVLPLSISLKCLSRFTKDVVAVDAELECL